MGLPPNLECAYGTVRLGKLDSSVNSSVLVIGMQRLIRRRYVSCQHTPVPSRASVLVGSSVCNSVNSFTWTVVTWLILPVVICLSQRLSHACLSIHRFMAKPRMAH